MSLKQDVKNVITYYIPILTGYLIADIINYGFRTFKHPIITRALLGCLICSILWVIIDKKRKERNSTADFFMKIGASLIALWIVRMLVV